MVCIFGTIALLAIFVIAREYRKPTSETEILLMLIILALGTFIVWRG